LFTKTATTIGDTAMTGMTALSAKIESDYFEK